MDSIGAPIIRYIFLSVFALLLLTACGDSDLDKLKQSKECAKRDLSGANLIEVNLGAVNLSGANLDVAILDGVRNADFCGAKNVPAEYLKD
tara:strand:- start:38 stop:310 length:273 start_codon:yes stop_codon:yes gene_type:complete